MQSVCKPLTLASLLLVAISAFADFKALDLQVRLDQLGFSPGCIDGEWGSQSKAALQRYCLARNIPQPANLQIAWETLCSDGSVALWRYDTIANHELAALTAIPASDEAKSQLEWLGFETILEAYAERSHARISTLKRLNPQVDWGNITPGMKIKVANLPPTTSFLSITAETPRPEARTIVINLGKKELAAYDAKGNILLYCPCSIARERSKAPLGILKVTSLVPNPNYTKISEYGTKKGKKWIFSPGPNNPVGVAWIGLSLPGYGIHGTPTPEKIGRAESHGCFRLANWNAARLYCLCRIGTIVKIVE